MNARIASTLAVAALAAASALATSVSHAADLHVGGKSADPQGYTYHLGKRDPYTDGARVGDKRDPFTDGARQGNPDGLTERVSLSPGRRSYFSIQLAGRDLTGVSAPPGSSDRAVS